MENKRELAPLQSRSAKIPTAAGLSKATRKTQTAKASNADLPAETESIPKKGTPKKAPITINLPVDLQGKARAAFRYAAFHEHVANFGDLVANALEAEVKRIQDEYNNGEDFEPDFEPLAKGRKPKR